MIVRQSRTMLCAIAFVATASSAISASAQATTAPEDVGPALVTDQRISTLPVAERGAWTAYVRASRRLHDRDTASMNAELQAVGRTLMGKAPYKAPDFQYFNRSDEWFSSDSIPLMAYAVLSFQTPSGGWSKRTDMTSPRTPGMSYYSETPDWHYIPTLDNGSTTGQLRFLARVMTRNADPRFPAAYHRGIEYLLSAQQPNGCWPQSFPLEGGYHDAITFNDDATVLVLTTLDDVAAGRVAAATPSERERAASSAHRGVQCLLETQVVVKGKRTVWGQQHDPISLEIVPARKYELAGLAGRESAAIMMYLMSLPAPDDHVIAAVDAAAQWFRAHAINGFRYESYTLRAEPNGATIWPRLTEVSTDKPIFANRDAIKLYDWNKLTDRRSGYGWFGTEP
ncbi:MAG: pectate lyase, partial [bacterium]